MFVIELSKISSIQIILLSSVTVIFSIIGDLFISVDRVKENSLKECVSFEKELERVVYHGVLHLCGYKDKTEKEIKEMRSKENYYLL